MNRNQARILALVAAAFVVALPAFAGDYPLQVARNVMMYMALAVTWDMLLRSGRYPSALPDSLAWGPTRRYSAS